MNKFMANLTDVYDFGHYGPPPEDRFFDYLRPWSASLITFMAAFSGPEKDGRKDGQRMDGRTDGNINRPMPERIVTGVAQVEQLIIIRSHLGTFFQLCP